MIKRLYAHNFKCLQNFEFNITGLNSVFLLKRVPDTLYFKQTKTLFYKFKSKQHINFNTFFLTSRPI